MTNNTQANTTQRSTARIAVCLSGQLRTFDSCVNSIMNFFGPNVDYFCHTWDINIWASTSTNKLDNFKKERLSNKEVIDRISVLNPKNVKIESQLKWKHEPCEAQQYGIKSAFNMCAQYAVQHNKMYDVVVRCRYDLIWERFVEFNPLINKDTLYITKDIELKFPDKIVDATMDRFFYGDFDTMKNVCVGLYWQTQRNLNKNFYSYPEACLRQIIVENNIKTKTHNCNETIVRQDCVDLNWMTDFELIQDRSNQFYFK